MHRFAAQELAIAVSGPKETQKMCLGQMCQSGDTCTNVTSTNKKTRKRAELISEEDLDLVLEQLTEAATVG